MLMVSRLSDKRRLGTAYLEIVDGTLGEGAMGGIVEVGNVDEPDKDTDDGNDLCESVSKVVELLLERGRLRDLRGDVLVDVANGRVGSGQDNNSGSVSSDNCGARKEHVDLVLLDGLCVLDGVRLLADALALSGQNALVDTETVAVDGQNSAVGGNAITHSHLDNVSWDQLVCLDALNFGIANNLGHVGRVLLERGDCLLGRRFLRHANDGVEDQDGENLGVWSEAAVKTGARQRTYNNGINEDSPVVAVLEESKHKGYSGRAKEDEDKLVLELFQDEFPQRGRRLLRNS